MLYSTYRKKIVSSVINLFENNCELVVFVPKLPMNLYVLSTLVLVSCVFNEQIQNSTTKIISIFCSTYATRNFLFIYHFFHKTKVQGVYCVDNVEVQHIKPIFIMITLSLLLDQLCQLLCNVNDISICRKCTISS